MQKFAITDGDSKLAFERLKSEPPEYIAADVETRSTKDVTPLGVGFCTPNMDAFYIQMSDPEFPFFLFNSETKTRVVWYNAPFDLHRESFGKYDIDLSKTEDAIICARNQAFTSNTLEDVSQMVAHQARNMGDVLKEYAVKTVDELPLKEVAMKCIEDCMATMDIWHWLRPKIDNEYYETERLFLETLLRMSHKGLNFDRDRARAIDRELEAEIIRVKGYTDYYGVNPHSGRQVAAVLNEEGYWLPQTRKGNPRTDAATLANIPHPLATIVTLAKQYGKLHNTYTHPWLSEDRIHSQFKMDATTGRTSSANYNLQNIPKGDKTGAIVPKAGSLRSIFIPDGEYGTKWDLSQIELRMLALLSGDEAMQAIMADSTKDLHTETQLASKALGFPITRTEAKGVNFKMVFSGGEGIHPNILRAWQTRFPTAWDWIKKQQQEVLDTLVVETYFGRKLNVRLTNKGLASAKHIMNCGVNWPIQGSAAEFFKRIANEITKHVIPMEYHRSQIHDEFWEEGQWVIPEEIEHMIDGVWTPIEQEIVERYG